MHLDDDDEISAKPSLDLVDEDIGHPDDVSLAGVEGEVAADGVLTVQLLFLGGDPTVLENNGTVEIS